MDGVAGCGDYGVACSWNVVECGGMWWSGAVEHLDVARSIVGVLLVEHVLLAADVALLLDEPLSLLLGALEVVPLALGHLQPADLLAASLVKSLQGSLGLVRLVCGRANVGGCGGFMTASAVCVRARACVRTRVRVVAQVGSSRRVHGGGGGGGLCFVTCSR